MWLLRSQCCKSYLVDRRYQHELEEVHPYKEFSNEQALLHGIILNRDSGIKSLIESKCGRGKSSPSGWFYEVEGLVWTGDSVRA